MKTPRAAVYVITICLLGFISACAKEQDIQVSKIEKVAAGKGAQQVELQANKINVKDISSSPKENPIVEKPASDKGQATVKGNQEVAQQNNTTIMENVKHQNRIIVIDPGHSNHSNLQKEQIAPGASELKIKDGGGAQGIITKTPEYEVNMKVAIKLKELLDKEGFTVLMTKTKNSESLGNIERAEIGNKANANLVIRIHADSSNSSSAKGASMLVPVGINDNTKAIYKESKRCGTIILNKLTEEVGMQNRGVVESNNMTGFNWSKVPVILVEMGFLSNTEEDKLLSSTDYQNKLARALTDGIISSQK